MGNEAEGKVSATPNLTEEFPMADARFCPACGGRVAASKGRVNGYDILQCRRCKTLYTSEVPFVDFTEEYEEYYSDSNLHPPTSLGASLDRTFATFEPYRRTGRLIDVGFGAGTSMEAAARAGWTVEGVEVSKPAVEHVSQLGFSTFHGELQDAGYPDDHFDVAVASEVLEHVSDPASLLEEIARIVRRGGLLWATTPHGRGVSAAVLGLEWSIVSPPEHLQLFSRRGIRELLGATGFAPRALKAEAVNPLEIVHCLKRRVLPGVRESAGFDRVDSGYSILEKVDSHRTLKIAKAAVNATLNSFGLGDSLKVWAESTRQDPARA